MTILGAIAHYECITLWTDREMYEDGEPAGERVKLQISPHGVAVLGTGICGVLRLAQEASQDARSLDDLAFLLRRRLPKAAASLTSRLPNYQAPDIKRTRIVAAGYSARIDRMMLATFTGLDAFEPHMVTSYFSPPVPGAGALAAYPPGWLEARRLAQKQMAMVRRKIGDATGIALDYAKITRFGVDRYHEREFFELPAGRDVQRARPERAAPPGGVAGWGEPASMGAA